MWAFTGVGVSAPRPLAGSREDELVDLSASLGIRGACYLCAGPNSQTKGLRTTVRKGEVMPELGALELAQMTKDLDSTKKMIFSQQYQSERKDSGTAMILAFFGWDRFWLGDIGLGLLKWITGGGCGIWWLIDLFTAKSRCDSYNRQKAGELLEAIRMS
jgi:TM2 domain-containing membrane protein YozV